MIFNSTASTLFEQLPSLPTSITLQSLPSISLESGAISGALIVGWGSLLQCLTLSTLWKALLVIHILLNFKHFPLVYHLRILNAIRFVLRSQRPKEDVTPEQLFQPIITSSSAPLTEIDVFGHKSNSTYFADVDVARVHLVTTLFGNGIYKFRGSTTMNGLSGKKASRFTMALGAVSCTFRREIKPYETYDMYTRVLTWDEKWLYMVTHFVKKDAKVDPREMTLYPKQNSKPSRKSTVRSPVSSDDASKGSNQQTRSPVAASALSKVVFKDGRKTLAPNFVLELSGLIPSREVKKGGQKMRGGWTWEKMEAERVRGMSQVQHLTDQGALEQEFCPEIALGRHYDGYGIEGVVSTLAQLGGLSRYQLL